MLALTCAMPDAYWDAFLLQRFPGKTLEELDGIDWGRLCRALHVQQIDRIEDMREQYLRGKYKPTLAEMSDVMRHDRLLNAGGNHE